LNLQPESAHIAVVIGRKESGKSFRVKRALATWPRWVAWDLKGEYAAIEGARLWTDVRDFAAHLASGGTVERDVFACAAWQFDAWCRWVFATGDLVAVVEEVTRYVTSGWAPEPLQDLFDRNRHARVDLVCVAPRLAEIPKGLLHQADDLLLANIDLPDDLSFIRKWKGPAIAERVANLNLERHEFLRIRR
jgi:hypothetical protein